MIKYSMKYIARARARLPGDIAQSTLQDRPYTIIYYTYAILWYTILLQCYYNTILSYTITILDYTILSPRGRTKRGTGSLPKEAAIQKPSGGDSDFRATRTYKSMSSLLTKRFLVEIRSRSDPNIARVSLPGRPRARRGSPAGGRGTRSAPRPGSAASLI